MIAQVSNQNFGCVVACDGNWAAVGNPNPFHYDPLSSSFTRTGSVEIYKYNINSDIHDKKTTLFRPLTSEEVILLSTEETGSNYYILHTEYTGSIPYTADLDLQVDTGLYYSASGDGYGQALDLRGTLLAVGYTYYVSRFLFETSSFFYSGSRGYIDLFDVSTLDIDPYAKRTPPTIIGSSSVGGYITIQARVPSGQNYTSIIFQKRTLISDWINVAASSTSNSGGDVNILTSDTTSSLSGSEIRVIGVIGIDPYLTTLYNPNPAVTESFGSSISLNDEWLAVGSPLESGSRGSVFMFRKYGGNNLSWSFFQTLPLPSDIVVGDSFGYDIGMNKATSSFSWSMVVGSSKLSQSKAYVYEFDGVNWNNTLTLFPDSSSIYPLPFYPTLPIVSNYQNTHDSFGYAVSMYGNTVMIGAPTDRIIQEYESSSFYRQGAVYFFERCDGGGKYYLARKSYGNENILNENMLGWSVSVYDKYAVAGVPKTNALSSSVCYLRGSLFQEHFCDNDSADLLNGQFILYNKITGSTFIDWNITNIYQVKKRFLSPYRVYGWDTDISNQFIIIGSPMLISGSNTVMDLSSTTGSFTGSVDIIGDLSGKAYIYNLKNLRPNFYVGNVFYKNGKIVIMTSGSNFQGLQFTNTTTTEESKYDINFTSKQTVFEKQIVCPVEIGEFNVSTNPTAVAFPDANFDINQNGKFDFQDADILLRYMVYKNTEVTGQPNTDWSSSILDTTTDEELSVYNMYFDQWSLTDSLFISNYSTINNTLYTDLDFNDDNKINSDDMNILWKYFIYRLTQ